MKAFHMVLQMINSFRSVVTFLTIIRFNTMMNVFHMIIQMHPQRSMETTKVAEELPGRHVVVSFLMPYKRDSMHRYKITIFTRETETFLVKIRHMTAENFIIIAFEIAKFTLVCIIAELVNPFNMSEQLFLTTASVITRTADKWFDAIMNRSFMTIQIAFRTCFKTAITNVHLIDSVNIDYMSLDNTQFNCNKIAMVATIRFDNLPNFFWCQLNISILVYIRVSKRKIWGSSFFIAFSKIVCSSNCKT